jgi:hypothetical protein
MDIAMDFMVVFQLKEDMQLHLFEEVDGARTSSMYDAVACSTYSRR